MGCQKVSLESIEFHTFEKNEDYYVDFSGTKAVISGIKPKLERLIRNGLGTQTESPNEKFFYSPVMEDVGFGRRRKEDLLSSAFEIEVGKHCQKLRRKLTHVIGAPFVGSLVRRALVNSPFLAQIAVDTVWVRIWTVVVGGAEGIQEEKTFALHPLSLLFLH